MAVYFIAPESRQSVKIGYARDVEARHRDLQNSSCEPLVVLGVVAGGTSLERELHKRFATHRSHGEWFRLSDPIQSYIDANCGSVDSIPVEPSRGPSKRQPKYRLHKASGKAIVEIRGYRHYLGKYDSPESHRKYDQIIAEWRQNPLMPQRRQWENGITIVEILVDYLHFADAYYRKDGNPTGEIGCIKSSLRYLKNIYGQLPAQQFTPVFLKAVRQQMVDCGLSRGTVNKHVHRILRFFKWAVSENLLPVTVYEALRTVSGLRRGRTAAAEPEPIKPVTDGAMWAAHKHLPAVVGDMVLFQRYTGCRPEEACILRPCDIMRDGKIWEYRPHSHKTEHYGHERIIFIGPMAQHILLKYLARDENDYCFQPRESEAKRRAAQNVSRVVPFHYGNRPGSNRRRRPRRTAGDRYTVASYRRAIHRACDKAKVDRWSPNRLRHAAATEIRKRFGLEAAQVALGHTSADVTQVYAERDYALAARVAKEVG
jgi:integrase